MATKVGGFPSNSQSHLENISTTGSQIPPHFGNNCSKRGVFCFVFLFFFLFVLILSRFTNYLTLSYWVGGRLDGGVEGVPPPHKHTHTQTHTHKHTSPYLQKEAGLIRGELE